MCLKINERRERYDAMLSAEQVEHVVGDAYCLLYDVYWGAVVMRHKKLELLDLKKNNNFTFEVLR